MWQRVIRGVGRFKVGNLIGHGFCCILFDLALLLVSYRTAIPCSRGPIRTKQLSTVAALFCRFLSGCCLAKSTFSRSISLAVCVTVYFWLIRSLVDPTSTSSIITRGPLQFSRLIILLVRNPIQATIVLFVNLDTDQINY